MCMDTEQVNEVGITLRDREEKPMPPEQPQQLVLTSSPKSSRCPHFPWSPSSSFSHSLVSSPTSSVSSASLSSSVLSQLQKALPSLQSKLDLQSLGDEDNQIKPKQKMHVQPQDYSHLPSQSQSQSQSHVQPISQSPCHSRPCGLTLVRVWLFYIMIPIALVAWIETQSIIIAAVASLVPFVWAIYQGTISILKFRVLYGDSPHPSIPCHGVVIADPEDRIMSMASLPSSSSMCLKSSSPKDVQYLSERAMKDNRTEPPLRLLVIGDSLAIGVGQKKFSTPIMPETIAKRLSKAMGGRVVYWSCHGKSGASTSWVINELERGMENSKQECHHNMKNEEKNGVEENFFIQDDSGCYIDCLKDTMSECSDYSTDTDANSLFDTYSDVSSDDGSCAPYDQQQDEEDEEDDEKQQHIKTSDEARRSLQVWKERLKEHRKRFDVKADVMGPYDIVVFLTGGNDLKGAVLPSFLLRADKDNQKQQGQGGYESQLRRVLDILFRKMRILGNSISERVEQSPQNVGESNHPTEESTPLLSRCCKQVEGCKNASCKVHKCSEEIQSRANANGCEQDMQQSSNLPLVVLPGMPARLLRVFRKRPLHWLAVPAVSIMDTCKRKLARSFPDNVLFVESSTLEDVNRFVSQKGDLWEQRFREETLLSLKDIQDSESSRMEEDMKAYHEQKQGSFLAKLLHDTSPLPHDALFSDDGVHPNDEGYDFWGRHIAAGIIRDLENKNRLKCRS